VLSLCAPGAGAEELPPAEDTPPAEDAHAWHRDAPGCVTGCFATRTLPVMTFSCVSLLPRATGTRTCALVEPWLRHHNAGSTKCLRAFPTKVICKHTQVRSWDTTLQTIVTCACARTHTHACAHTHACTHTGGAAHNNTARPRLCALLLAWPAVNL